jgi:hypothetical protein
MPRRRNGLLLLSVLIAAVAGGTVYFRGQVTARGQGTDCPERFGTFSTDAHSWPPACWRPYGPNSPFNTPIPLHPNVAPESGAVIGYMLANHWGFESYNGRFVMQNSGSRPVYWSSPHDPLVRVICRGGFTCQPGMVLRIPPGARPDSNSDGHLTVVAQGRGLEFDFWQATAPSNGTMSVSSGNSIPIGADSGTGLGGVAEAAYFGLLGGLLRASELTAGRIDHALAITVPCVRDSDVWPSPAYGSGNVLCPGGAGPHFGTLLQLNMSDAAIARSGAPRWQRAIMLAMAHYGMYVVDASGLSDTMTLVKEADDSFTSIGLRGRMARFIRSVGGSNGFAAGVGIDVSRFRVIAPCVPQRTC